MQEAENLFLNSVRYHTYVNMKIKSASNTATRVADVNTSLHRHALEMHNSSTRGKLPFFIFLRIAHSHTQSTYLASIC